MSCIACVADCHGECYDPKDNACCCPPTTQLAIKASNATKEDDEVTDPESTGRKRAAVLFPISKGMACEWRGLKDAGGGVKRIVGCVNGDASNRHHGPDKNTLNNSEGNVHRICATCHNRWHAANDSLYMGKKTLPDALPHDSESRATPEEQVTNEMYWASRPEYRTKEE